jgi:hypothetical protein
MEIVGLEGLHDNRPISHKQLEARLANGGRDWINENWSTIKREWPRTTVNKPENGEDEVDFDYSLSKFSSQQGRLTLIDQ